MTAVALHDGWLTYPYTGPDTALVEIAVGEDDWTPAFLDYDATGLRVAKIRPPAGARNGAIVQLRVNAVIAAQDRYPG